MAISYSRAKSFLLLGQSGTFPLLEPRCHLWESQDLSVNEWEETAEELTQHASDSITHLSCIWVKYQRLFSLRGFDQHPRFETDSEWKVFQVHLTACYSGKTGPDMASALVFIGTAPQMIWALSRFHDSLGLPEEHLRCDSSPKEECLFRFGMFIEVCRSVSAFVLVKLSWAKDKIE